MLKRSHAVPAPGSWWVVMAPAWLGVFIPNQACQSLGENGQGLVSQRPRLEEPPLSHKLHSQEVGSEERHLLVLPLHALQQSLCCTMNSESLTRGGGQLLGPWGLEDLALAFGRHLH